MSEYDLPTPPQDSVYLVKIGSTVRTYQKIGPAKGVVARAGRENREGFITFRQRVELWEVGPEGWECIFFSDPEVLTVLPWKLKNQKVSDRWKREAEMRAYQKELSERELYEKLRARYESSMV